MWLQIHHLIASLFLPISKTLRTLLASATDRSGKQMRHGYHISVSLSPSSAPLPSIVNPKPLNSLKSQNPSLFISSPLIYLPTLSSKRTVHSHDPLLLLHNEFSLKNTTIWRISAVSGDALPSEANLVENSEQIASAGDDPVTKIISLLLILAFIGLSILTIGIIYIAVTDFLQKRESEKFAKEEAAKKKKKKKGKKEQLRAKAGPRGFGQKKIEEEDDD